MHIKILVFCLCNALLSNACGWPLFNGVPKVANGLSPKWALKADNQVKLVRLGARLTESSDIVVQQVINLGNCRILH